MAKAKINKSAAIREALAAAPDKPATAIAKEIGVTATLVYNVKAAMKKKAGAGKGKPGRKAGAKPGRTAAPATAHDLDSAFEFVMRVGGLRHAEELIGKLKAIKEKL